MAARLAAMPDQSKQVWAHNGHFGLKYRHEQYLKLDPENLCIRDLVASTVCASFDDEVSPSKPETGARTLYPHCLTYCGSHAAVNRICLNAIQPCRTFSLAAISSIRTREPGLSNKPSSCSTGLNRHTTFSYPPVPPPISSP